MALRHTYFSASGLNPLPYLERWWHPHRNGTTVTIRDRAVGIRWTDRARRALAERESALYVEMQLYFSCVVQKHVVFHDTPDHSDFVEAGDNLYVRASAVESDICTPEEFAASHPARRELDSAAAMRMVPRSLWLDYRRGAWTGEMAVGAKT